MPKNFFEKFIVCFLGGLVTGRVVMRLGQRFLFPWIPPAVMMALGLLIILAAGVYAFIWNRTAWRLRVAADSYAGTGYSRNERIFSSWIGIIRYSVALDLIMVGLQKWFHLQFNTPLAKLDLPFSSFSSEELSWAFFGHSFGFVRVIGGLQILGSGLLLFNRTRLLGTVALIPVMLNITLMDLFYQFDVGEWLSALILLTALLFLLLLDYEKLAAIFLRSRGSHPVLFFKNSLVKSSLVKNAARLSAFCIPLALIWINPTPYRHDRFTGKYTIEHLVVNGHPLTANSCTDSVLTVIYFDQANQCVFEYNGNGLDRRLFGTYRLDETGNGMTVVWHYPKDLHDTLRATLSGTTFSGAKPQTGFTMSGKIGKDRVEADLMRVDQ